jgi:hypothetical protein
MAKRFHTVITYKGRAKANTTRSIAQAKREFYRRSDGNKTKAMQRMKVKTYSSYKQAYDAYNMYTRRTRNRRKAAANAWKVKRYGTIAGAIGVAYLIFKKK